MLSVLALTLYRLSYQCTSTPYKDKVYWQVKWEGEERDLAHKPFIKPGHLSLGSQLCCVLKYHTTETGDILNSHTTYTTVSYDHFWRENVLFVTLSTYWTKCHNITEMTYLSAVLQRFTWKMHLKKGSALTDDDLCITVIKGKQIWANTRKWQMTEFFYFNVTCSVVLWVHSYVVRTTKHSYLGNNFLCCHKCESYMFWLHSHHQAAITTIYRGKPCVPMYTEVKIITELSVLQVH